MTKKQKAQGLAAIFAVLLAAAVPAKAEYVMHARVSYDAGGTMVLGADGGQWSQAPVNTLILPGDTLWVDAEDVSELEMPGGIYLRMADASKAELRQLPPSATVRGWKGSFYVQRLARSSGSLVFETPAAMVEVDKDTTIRIDIEEDGSTVVTTRWGRATVRTESGGATFVHEGRRVWVDPGMLPSMPAAYDRDARDAFDDFSRERSAALVAPAQPLPPAVQIDDTPLGVTDLGTYGEWVYVDNTPYWRPTVVVDYVPYRYGHWSYTSGIGNVWVGRYPFSYITSHHGHWHHDRHHGWLWSYNRQWSPAYAATMRYGDYYVWSPVDRYHRPVLGYRHDYFSLGGIQFSHFSTSYVHCDSLYGGPGYIYGTHHNGFHYDPHHSTNVNIWNININGNNNHVRPPFDPGTGSVRDYNPNRAIRGLTGGTYRDRAHSVDNIVAGLERGTSRRTFDSGGLRSGSRSDRTSLNGRNAAVVRRTTIASERPSYLRATSRNPERATEARDRVSVRPGGSDRLTGGGGGDGAPRSVSGRDSDPRGTASVRGTGTRDGGTSSVRGAGTTTSRSGERDAVSPRGRDAAVGQDGPSTRTVRPGGLTTTPGGTTPPSRGSVNTRSNDTGRETPVRGTTSVGERGQDGASTRTVRPGGVATTPPTTTTRTPWRSGDDNQTRSNPNLRIYTSTPPSRGGSSTEVSGDRTSTERTAPRTVSPSGSTGRPDPGDRSRTVTSPRPTAPATPTTRTAPPTTTVDRSGTTSNRTRTFTSTPPSRSSAGRPEPTSPARTVISPRSSSSSNRTPSSVRAPESASAPRTQSSVRTISSLRTTGARTSSNSPTRSYTAPSTVSRSTGVTNRTPSASRAPVTTRNAPTINRSAPSVTRSAPTINRSAPSISRSAPSRSSSPSISRSAPSRSSAPSISRSAPSRSSAPSISRGAPSRSSSTSISRSAPSRSTSGGASARSSSSRARR